MIDLIRKGNLKIYKGNKNNINTLNELNIYQSIDGSENTTTNEDLSGSLFVATNQFFENDITNKNNVVLTIVYDGINGRQIQEITISWDSLNPTPKDQVINPNTIFVTDLQVYGKINK